MFSLDVGSVIVFSLLSVSLLSVVQDSGCPPHPDRLTVVAPWISAGLCFGAVHTKFLKCASSPAAGQRSSLRLPVSRCGTPLAAPRNNIPILSICCCGALSGLSGGDLGRYPWSEALTGALFVLVLYHTGPGRIFLFLVYAAFVAALVVVTFIDLDHHIIPDVISLPGIVMACCSRCLGNGPGVVETWWARCWVAASSTRSPLATNAFTGREGDGRRRHQAPGDDRAFLGGKNVWSPVGSARSSGALIGIGPHSHPWG